MTILTINKSYNFSLYPIPILGSSYKNLKLISILDYDTALKFDNVELLSKSAYPYLPPGTSSNFRSYIFYLFKTDTNKNIVLANEWIIESTIEEVSSLNYTLRLNNISLNQLNTIKDQLRLLGISFDILN